MKKFLVILNYFFKWFEFAFNQFYAILPVKSMFYINELNFGVNKMKDFSENAVVFSTRSIQN